MNSVETALQEKRNAALTSVIAAVFLTVIKIVVGAMTESLGILSEAAHSGLDLAAAAVTLFAVRVSSRPADREHPYGHGKIENLSALFETLLLLITCTWIVSEAIERLFFRRVHVDANIWSFLVMVASIVIDFSRSRVLMKAAKKHKSQALEADALHFSTDVWSSSVVIAGLAFVWLSDRINLPWLDKADAIAAMGVACIVVYVSLKLGWRTITALIDGVPGSLLAEVTDAVRIVPDVQGVDLVRVRQSGPESFVDVHLGVGRETGLERADSIRSLAEQAVRKVLPGADVTVQVRPVRREREDLLTGIRVLAARHGMGAHAIRCYDRETSRSLELHLEVSDSLSLDQAHEQVTALERDLKSAFPEVNDVVSHIEPIGLSSTQHEGVSQGESPAMEIVRDLPARMNLDFRPHQIRIRHVGADIHISFHCELPPQVGIVDAHSVTEKIEQALRAQIPNLGRVVIHVEPPRTPDEE
jgi:cation diffusion facilitator family transporter